MDGERFGTRHDVPRVGEHNESILRELGYSAADITALQAQKAI